MLRFHIDVDVSYVDSYDPKIQTNPQGFYWSCYSNNNKILFYCGNVEKIPRLRNCINQIRTITKHFKPGSHCIVLTKAADNLRKKLDEPLYGIKNGQCI